jgi:hypothetical protein
MAVTLPEAAKLNSGNVLKQAIIEFYAGSSDILRVLPFEGIQGNALQYNREETLPGVGFRGVNESFTESTGVINPQTEALAISGGDLDVDNFIIRTMGPNQRSTQERMKVRALALQWTKKFIKGDSSSEPREFDGLQVRLTGGQRIDAGATSGGDALSLLKLDELIDQVENPTHLIMNKTMRRRLTVASRNQAVGGHIRFETDEFGRQVTLYNDLPILLVDLDNEGNAILPFTEANPGGGAAASTSIYCVSMTDEGVMGLENGGIDPRDLGELDSKPVVRTRVEWYSSFGVFHSRGAARLRGIKDAAVVA